jgi:hypothetical protein
LRNSSGVLRPEEMRGKCDEISFVANASDMAQER